MQQNTKLEKIGVVPNSLAPFLWIFVENGSQDGGQNPSEIDKNIDLKFYVFLIGFWMRFGRDLRAKMGEKPMPKQCQEHVAIDFEVAVAETQKMTPLIAFLLLFQVKLGPKFDKHL